MPSPAPGHRQTHQPARAEIPAFGPVGPGGLGREALLDSVGGWVRADAMRRLATASGWPWPEGPLQTSLADLAQRSADWDFRRQLAARAESTGERHALTSIKAEVGGQVIEEDLIAAAAAELGLAGGHRIAGPFTHIVALGGMARACLNRTREAARLRDELDVARVAVLTAHRPLGGNEPADALAAGWRELELESQAAAAAARDIFGLPERPDSETAGWWDGDPEVPQGVDPEEWRRRQSWEHRHWQVAEPLVEVDVVTAPSSEPSSRRTNTADQLSFWAERAGIGSSHAVLLVTTDHYVPAQHFDAIRTLGLSRGCGVDTCGVEWAATGRYRGAAYLQEVRSGLLAAARLLDTIDALPSS